MILELRFLEDKSKTIYLNEFDAFIPTTYTISIGTKHTNILFLRS
jgi:hypothetical protein